MTSRLGSPVPRRSLREGSHPVAIMQGAGRLCRKTTLGGCSETSPPTISASGRGRCRAATYSRIARAQNCPSRFVRIVVPFPPGGSADPVARILAARLSEIWGQQVVAENKAGAGGNIAAVSMTQSAADAYTLFCGGDFLASASVRG